MERILWFHRRRFMICHTHSHKQLPTAAAAAVAGVYFLVMALLANNAYWFLKVGTLSDNICTILLIEFRNTTMCRSRSRSSKGIEEQSCISKIQKLQMHSDRCNHLVQNYICFASTRKMR